MGTFICQSVPVLPSTSSFSDQVKSHCLDLGRSCHVMPQEPCVESPTCSYRALLNCFRGSWLSCQNGSDTWAVEKCGVAHKCTLHLWHVLQLCISSSCFRICHPLPLCIFQLHQHPNIQTIDSMHRTESKLWGPSTPTFQGAGPPSCNLKHHQNQDQQN